MSSTDPLRRAFTGFADETPVSENCPEPDQIWAAVHGELPVEAIRDLVDHTAACPSCAEEWRLAREVGASLQAAGEVLSASHRLRRFLAPLVGLAAAAVLVLVIVSPWQSPKPPAFRMGEEAAIESLLPADEALPRDDCRLRWSAVEGAVYTVLVSDAQLTVIARAEELTEPQFRVPPEVLGELPPGAEIYWQVEAVLPDGTRHPSRTFVHSIQ